MPTTSRLIPGLVRTGARLGGLLLLTMGLASPTGVRPTFRQLGEIGRFEVEGFDFRADGAWRRGTAAIRSRRHRLLHSLKLASLNTAAQAVGGTYRVPVIPIAFSNVPAPFPSASYQSVLFDEPATAWAYSVRSYYTEASRGRVNLSGTVLGWSVADSVDSYYEDGCNGIGVLAPCPHGGVRLGELLLEGLRQTDDGSVDWGGFDNDGADGLPNSGDDDGVVDFVLFLQPEVDGACGTTNLWAHRYDLAVWNGGSPYVTRSPRKGSDGQPIPGSYILVRDYTLQSAVGGAGACADGGIMPIGTVSHEIGHAFGLPDLYDTNLRSAAVTQGVGEWSIMGSGNYTQPYSPAAFDAWSLAELGWIALDSLAAEQSVNLAPVALGNSALYAPVPGTDEYFLFENRQALGSDSAQMNPECRFRARACNKGPGLLIWHIDQGQINAHGFNRDNRVNSGVVHGVALVQADGLEELRAPGGRDRGDGGDPWPGTTGATRFGPATTPAALDNLGRTAGFALDSIRQLQPMGAVAFHFSFAPPETVTLTLPWARDEILGLTSLGPAQLAYLDSLGNANGRYDVGDFLAYYRSQSAAAGSRAP